MVQADENAEQMKVIPADQVATTNEEVTRAPPQDVAVKEGDITLVASNGEVVDGGDEEGGGGCNWSAHPIYCLFKAIVKILKAIVKALQNYATDIAVILVGSMLGLAVARFGRTMFRRVAGLISL